MTNLVQWQRFWYPHDKESNLHGGGYLIDPLAENGKWLNPNVVTFESIESIPCLVLLAEPGMGKTRTLRDIEFPRIKQVLESEGNKCLWVDLAECRSDYRLDKELIESDEIKQFPMANHQLHIFLDSLDEGPMSPTKLLEYLIRFLRKTEVLNNLRRLYLRLICRSSVWPMDYQSKLRELWAEDQVRVFKLAPLRGQDVEQFARVNKVDEKRFLQELAQKQAVPFAATPATLQMLVSLYKRDGQFPSKQTELYEQGCLQLCEDTESRKELDVSGKISVNARMQIAGRIAVVTIFTDQPSVFIGSRSDSLFPEGVTIAGLLFYNEREALDRGMPNAIEETLTCTGLFTTTQSKQCYWAHRTYAEFLAAWFLL